MVNKIFIFLSLLPLLLGCNKSTISMEPEGDKIKISFSTKEFAAEWKNGTTKGVTTATSSNLASIMAYSFISDAGSNITGCYIDNKEALQDNGIWGFIPTYYYPINESLDFLAYSPKANLTSDDNTNNGVLQELDFESKSINFSYYLPNIGRNHPDLLIAAPVKGCNINYPLSVMELKHVLTKLTMSAKVSDRTEAGRYAVTRFTINNITTGATLNYGVESGIGSWSKVSVGAFIASEVFPNIDLGEERVLLEGSYNSVMATGHSLFMIPQEIDSRAKKPTIQITVLDTHTDVTYITDKIILPSPAKGGWQMGQHVNLQFELDIDKSGIVIPMSFVARLLPWQDVNIDAELDENIFATLNTNTINANTIAELTLYTNGKIEGIESDGSVIYNAALGTPNNNYFYPIRVTTVNRGLGFITVKLKGANGKAISKTFNINVN